VLERGVVMVEIGEPESKDHLFKRVIFIGAGFSAGMRYPVGNTLTTRIMEYLDGRSPGTTTRRFNNSLKGKGLQRRKDDILKAIWEFLWRYFRVGPQGIQNVGVAEFFTMAHSLSETPSLFGLDEGEAYFEELHDGGAVHARHLFNILSCVTRTYFIDICRSVDLPEDIESFLEDVDPQRDAIVNFNWDEEVDIHFTSNRNGEAAYTRAAWRPPTKREERYLLLRPHGSIGWYDITCGLGNAGTYLIADEDRRVHRSHKRIVSYPEIGWPIDLGSGKPFSKLACPPMITPPTFAKRFQYKEQHRIWSDVLEVCSKAREFLFLGYSLPPDDYLTRAAICSSLTAPESEPAKCLVVGYDPGALANFKRAFGDSLTSEKNFLQWEFGSGKADLARHIEVKLKRAVV
jgi:hypothetical protein